MIECIKFTPFKKGNIEGFADLFIGKWGVVVHGCPLFSREGKRWVSFPGKEYQKGGETHYSPVLTFPSTTHQQAFTLVAKKAIAEFRLKEKSKPTEEEKQDG